MEIPGWSIAPDESKIPFADEELCYNGSTLSKCHLGALATLAEKTPPAECLLCIGDAGPDPDCCVDIKSCSPGARIPDSSFVFFGDPRRRNAVLADCTWESCRDTAADLRCPAGKVLVGVDLPELGGGADEDSIGCSHLAGEDNVRIKCCRMTIE